MMIDDFIYRHEQENVPKLESYFSRWGLCWDDELDDDGTVVRKEWSPSDLILKRPLDHAQIITLSTDGLS